MYSVLHFNKESFALALSNKNTPKERVESKKQFPHIYAYIQSLNCKSILIEDKFTSYDYLEDFIRNYTLSNQVLDKFVKRVHFFSQEFTQEELKQIIEEGKIGDLQKAYLGFIIIKPISKRSIGYTILKTPKVKNGKILTRKYVLSLVGFNLSISALAYQEQDKIVSACATTAIWIVLNKAREVHSNVRFDSPSWITKNATIDYEGGNRNIAKTGLDTITISKALRLANLNTHIYRGSEKWPVIRYSKYVNGKMIGNGIPVSLHIHNKKSLQRIIHAYLPSDIPIILTCSVPYDKASNTFQSEKPGDIKHDQIIEEYSNVHAITVIGYKSDHKKMDQVIQSPMELFKTTYAADFLDSIIAHDDQISPYTELSFHDFKCQHGIQLGLMGSWHSNIQNRNNRPILPHILIVPVNKFVRLEYYTIEAVTNGFDYIFSAVLGNYDFFSSNELIWDVYLIEGKRLKSALINEIGFPLSQRVNFTQKFYPGYSWVAKCYLKGEIFIYLIFDASLSSEDMCLVDIIIRDDINRSSEVYKYLCDNITAQFVNVVTWLKIENKIEYLSKFLELLNLRTNTIQVSKK